MREDERTTERARLSRGELPDDDPRREDERGAWSLLTREDKLGDGFSWGLVREQLSFGFPMEAAVGRAVGRLVALKAEDLGVETEERVDGVEQGCVLWATE